MVTVQVRKSRKIKKKYKKNNQKLIVWNKRYQSIYKEYYTNRKSL
jgi:hypothetical protein